MKNFELEKLRHEIDVTDNVILQALKRRSEVVSQIAEVKEREKISAHQPERFAHMLGNLELQAMAIGVDPELVHEVWTSIHNSSLRQQNIAQPLVHYD